MRERTGDSEMEGIKSIAIIGVGLIGGSLGLALKKANLVQNIIGIGRREEKLQQALKLGAVDSIVTDIYFGVKKVDLVILAVPVNSIMDIANQMVPYLKMGTIVMDVGSTKQKIVRKLTPSFSSGEIHFVGAHPLAGSEESGIEVAKPDLFEGATCVITPIPQTNGKAISTVRLLWEGIGAKVVEMSPELHDELIAYSSHLPHIIATALVDLIKMQDKKIISLLASGFKDTTRIAASHPVMWRDICLTNQEELLKSIDNFKKILEKWEDLIKNTNSEVLIKEFEEVKNFREQI
ncbi:MAG: prephenate dehydrogenase/arogenate dehydrogenase family protein [bacterium]